MERQTDISAASEFGGGAGKGHRVNIKMGLESTYPFLNAVQWEAIHCYKFRIGLQQVFHRGRHLQTEHVLHTAITTSWLIVQIQQTSQGCDYAWLLRLGYGENQSYLRCDLQILYFIAVVDSGILQVVVDASLVFFTYQPGATQYRLKWHSLPNVNNSLLIMICT